MKYLIQDTDTITLGEVNEYFTKELLKTNLKKEDIVIENSLQKKIAVHELERIFDENGMCEFYEMFIDRMELKKTGHNIEFSEIELNSRFDDVYNSILSNLREAIL